MATIPWQQQDPDLCRSHHHGDRESEAAFLSWDKAAWRDRVLKFIEAADGATPDEAAATYGCDVTTVRPRFTELKAQGLIYATGQKRPTKSGCMAKVYKVSKTHRDDFIQAILKDLIF